ncbi:ethanolamine-phosphate phospho-lyase-like [Hydra vulgaris]|uniref:Ethanolamine-phosphate phospho-lyase-like n=1 Tax=Hydra vulgaris TaxID=6087 RepID=A0ABM4BVE2_HYDVU
MSNITANDVSTCNGYSENRAAPSVNVTEIHLKRNQLIGRATQVFFPDKPLYIARGKGQYLYDENDVQYLDLMNNVAHVGHCHPKVVASGSHQMSILSTNCRFLHEDIVKVASKLTEKLPEKLKVCFFTNSGTESNDLAMRLAETYTKHKDVVVIDDAYHGHSVSLIDISPYKFKLLGFQKDYVHVVPRPDVYDGMFKGDHNDPLIGEMYADEAIKVMDNAVKNGRKIGMFIAESLLSCGGQTILPNGYLKKIYKHVHDLGGVCVADEVQVGLGRLGKEGYWGFERQGVVPDIVTIGKPLGNGHPVSCVVTTNEIAEAFERTKVPYFSTFGGNPVSMSIALSVLNVIEEENLIENAEKVGNFLREELKLLQLKFPIIGDVRGIGLFAGIVLTKNRETREPATEIAKKVCYRMRDHRILISRDGPGENVLKIKPPMVITIEDMRCFLNVLEIILNELYEEKVL